MAGSEKPAPTIEATKERRDDMEELGVGDEVLSARGERMSSGRENQCPGTLLPIRSQRSIRASPQRTARRDMALVFSIVQIVVRPIGNANASERTDSPVSGRATR
jgi:hypothetical protein